MFTISKNSLEAVHKDVGFQKKVLSILKIINEKGTRRSGDQIIVLNEICFDAPVSIKYKVGGGLHPKYDIRNDEISSIEFVYEKHHDEFKFISYCRFYALLKLKENRKVPYMIYCSKEKTHNGFNELKNIFYSADSSIKFVQFNEKNEFSNFKILMNKTREYLKTTFGIE